MSGIALGFVGTFGPILVVLLVIGICEYLGLGEHWLDQPEGDDDGD